MRELPPSKIVYSDFNSEDPHWNLMCLGHGYLDVANFSAREFPKKYGDLTQTHHALSIVFTLFQGLENFFKGALGHLDGDYPRDHRIEALIAKYNTNRDDLLTIETRSITWLFELERRAQVTQQANKDVGGQGLRYLIDKGQNFFWREILVPFDQVVHGCGIMVYLTRIIHGRLFIRLCDSKGIRYVEKPWWMTDDFYRTAIVPRFPIAGQSP